MITPQDKRKPERISVALHPDTVAKLDAFCEQMNGSERDYIIEKSLLETFARQMDKPAAKKTNAASRKAVA